MGPWLRLTASDRPQQSFLDHERHCRHHQAYQPSLHLPKERSFEIIHGITFQDSIAHIAMLGAIALGSELVLHYITGHADSQILVYITVPEDTYCLSQQMSAMVYRKCKNRPNLFLLRSSHFRWNILTMQEQMCHKMNLKTLLA